jgi:hypothetical protein
MGIYKSSQLVPYQKNKERKNSALGKISLKVLHKERRFIIARPRKDSECQMGADGMHIALYTAIKVNKYIFTSESI